MNPPCTYSLVSFSASYMNSHTGVTALRGTPPWSPCWSWSGHWWRNHLLHYMSSHHVILYFLSEIQAEKEQWHAWGDISTGGRGRLVHLWSSPWWIKSKQREGSDRKDEVALSSAAAWLTHAPNIALQDLDPTAGRAPMGVEEEWLFWLC